MCECPQRRSEVNWIEIDGDVVAVDRSTESIHVLRGAASAVWQLIDGAPLDGLELLVAETFGVDAETARCDIDAAVELLETIGLIECPCMSDR